MPKGMPVNRCYRQMLSAPPRGGAEIHSNSFLLCFTKVSVHGGLERKEGGKRGSSTTRSVDTLFCPLGPPHVAPVGSTFKVEVGGPDSLE